MTQFAGTQPTAGTRTTSHSAYRVEVIEQPKTLSTERCSALTQEFTDLSVKASGGRDWSTYVPGRVGWANYYQTEGARPQDYDRMVLVYAGNELAHFIALNVFWLDEKHPILWIHIAITDPAHQGAGILTMSSTALLSADWLKTVAPITYAIFRTPNPIVYEAMKAFCLDHLNSDDVKVSTWYPQINERGQLEPLPEDIRTMAAKLAKTLSPECPWDAEHFVIRGYFKKFGPLYSNTVQFPCRVAGTRNYFEQNVHLETQDGLLVIFVMKTNAG
jgi:hypothetical protein